MSQFLRLLLSTLDTFYEDVQTGETSYFNEFFLLTKEYKSSDFLVCFHGQPRASKMWSTLRGKNLLPVEQILACKV